MNIKQTPAHPNNYSTNKYVKKGIVLHWIVGEQSASDAAFANPSRIASTQYSISSDGEIHQYVPDEMTAYHAGVSEYNRHYIGIEHAGGQTLSDGSRKKPTQICHDTSAELVAMLCKKHNIPCDRSHIIKHKETGYPTQCCGSLDIDYIIKKANLLLKNNNMANLPVRYLKLKAMADPALQSIIVHESPDLNSPKLGSLQPGEVVSVVALVNLDANKSVWGMRTGSKIGYIDESHLVWVKTESEVEFERVVKKIKDDLFLLETKYSQLLVDAEEKNSQIADLLERLENAVNPVVIKEMQEKIDAQANMLHSQNEALKRSTIKYLFYLLFNTNGES